MFLTWLGAIRRRKESPLPAASTETEPKPTPEPEPAKMAAPQQPSLASPKPRLTEEQFAGIVASLLPKGCYLADNFIRWNKETRLPFYTWKTNVSIGAIISPYIAAPVSDYVPLINWFPREMNTESMAIRDKLEAKLRELGHIT